MSRVTATTGRSSQSGPPLPSGRGGRLGSFLSEPQDRQADRKTLIGAAVVVDLSKDVNTAADALKAQQEAAAIALRSFDEQLKARSGALATRLSQAFAKEGIPLDDAISLRFESGSVVSDSPYRKKIEKIFKDDPELTKEFESVSSLRAMRAAQRSLELYNEEKKKARSRDEQDRAYDHHAARMIDIQHLSGVMTLRDGALSSAAEDFMSVMSGETPSTTGAPRAEAMKRYASILKVAA